MACPMRKGEDRGERPTHSSRLPHPLHRDGPINRGRVEETTMRQGSSSWMVDAEPAVRARAKTSVEELEDMFHGLPHAARSPSTTNAVVLKSFLHRMLGILLVGGHDGSGEDDAAGHAAKATKGTAYSICLDLVDRARSVAKLQFGHKFHLVIKPQS